jgi:hypothetical protein
MHKQIKYKDLIHKHECQCEHGIIRAFGRDNEEIITDCPICENVILKKEIERLKGEVIFCFSEDEIPIYIQGYFNGTHEMTEVCTAEQVNNLVNLIVELRKKYEPLDENGNY